MLPWGERASGRTARIICDVADPDGTPFAGDPRVQLKKVLASAKAEGYEMSVGPEAEFFLFKRGEENRPTLDPHDHASYFDVYPDDLAEDTRRDIEDELTNLGFHLEASHHEVAIGQHEIDFRHADALTCADNLVTFRWVVKHAAARNGIHATFMPKPLYGENGSGMHINQSLSRGGENAFFDPSDELQLSADGLRLHRRPARAPAGADRDLQPDGQLLQAADPGLRGAGLHRLVAGQPLGGDPHPGQARPLDACRAAHARSRPRTRTSRSRACSQAGLDGVRRGLRPPEPVNVNIYHLSDEESAGLGIKGLPHNLEDALTALEADSVLRRRARRPHLRRLHQREARRMGRLPRAGARLGVQAVPRPVLGPRLNGEPGCRRGSPATPAYRSVLRVVNSSVT